VPSRAWRRFARRRSRRGRDTHDAALQDYLRATVAPYYHPVGTSRLGNDEMAVVDAELYVHGLAGLRVADASVMPSTVSADTNATVLAIAERAADVVRS
jgi:choline dehydrogenase